MVHTWVVLFAQAWMAVPVASRAVGVPDQEKFLYGETVMSGDAPLCPQQAADSLSRYAQTWLSFDGTSPM